MENKLEQLLNSLIERGWKPFHQEIKNKWGTRGNYPCEGAIKIRKNTIFISYRYESGNERINKWKKVQHSLRELVSAESGLWQFVCENGMYRKEYLGIYFNDERAKNVFYKIDQWDEEGDVIQTGDMEGDEFIHMSEPEYRIIESALRDESGLENFLLNNIKVGGK